MRLSKEGDSLKGTQDEKGRRPDCTGDGLDTPEVSELVKLNQANYIVLTMCRVLGVSRSGYYASLNGSPSGRSIEDARLTLRIEAIHKTS